MSKSHLTNKAVEDLADIWYYTADTWSENRADKYYNMLIDTFEELSSNSDLGKKYSGITENLCGIRAGRHIVFYRKIDEIKLEIIRILHEQMDLKERIKEE